MALQYNPLQNDFSVFEAVETPQVKLESPFSIEPLDISDWADSIRSNGTIMAQSNLPQTETTTVQTEQEEPTIVPGIDELRASSTSTNNKYKISKKDQQKKAVEIMNNLVNRGHKPHVAAGIVGNLIAESGLNAGVHGDDLGKEGGGLAGWRDDLFKNLKSKAKASGVAWTNVDFQIGYLNKLLNQDNKQMNDVRDRLSRATNPHEASEAWAYYERYAGFDGTTKTAQKAGWSQKRVDEEHAKRSGYANEVYDLWKKQA